jgi:S-adenosylmethionine:tRNA ribosyltransferase-isomerase
MDINEFRYELPESLIAQEPAKERHLSKMLVLGRETGKIEHRLFRDIKEYIRKGDCLVLNDTRVIPARLLGKRADTGGSIEFVLLTDLGNDCWEVILKPGRRAKPGARFIFGPEGELEAEIIEVVEQGNRIVRFLYNGDFRNLLEKVGEIPLPPYIRKRPADPERYQTVYSRADGSAAAPTAGLHFTDELLSEIRAMGVSIVYVTLHVGIGTFRPVKEHDITRHKMHKEYYQIGKESADVINDAKKQGGRIFAVGTTSCRVLETMADENGIIRHGEGWTDIFIYPGYKFKAVDAMITNFHLPGSTLIMLVCAFAGRENIMEAYRVAVSEKYRFYSFGDAMLLI